MLKKNKKVFVGMSGGVDSSVAAFLLKEEGYEVVGVFIKVWQPDFVECTWKEDRRDAIRVCSKLNIPFITLDLEKEYKEGVIDYMLEEYKNNRTPNPDVFCNKEVKFGAFLEWAIKNGADYIATGHYVSKNKENILSKAKDKSKDQSYFLWTLKKDQIEKTLFPLGSLDKKDVRKIAKKNNLIVANKKDSQGLCFIGKIDVKTFLKEYINIKPGKIIDLESNKDLGIHEGVYFYTIGEKVVGENIIKKDLENNILYVGDYSDKEEILKNKIILEQVNFNISLESGKTYSVAERYHAKETLIKITSIKENKKNNTLELDFTEEQAVSFIYTPGQSLVFFDKEILIGGGIMK